MIKYFLVPALILFHSPAFTQTDKEKPNPKDPKVIERLNEMGKYLRSLKHFELNADVNFEALVENDQKIDVEGELQYKVKSPNKLWVDLKTAHKHRQYYYDGKDFTVYAPDLKFYATAEAPDTLDKFIDEVQEKLNVELPLSDLFDWGTDKGNLDKVTIARFIEEYTRGNNKVAHYFVRQGDVDWQVWLPLGNRPLPEKIVYVSNKDNFKPKFSSELIWKINSQINDKTFDFNPPKNSHKIEFNTNNAQPENK